MTKWGTSNVTYSADRQHDPPSARRPWTFSKANRMATENAFSSTNIYSYDAFGQGVKTKYGATPFTVRYIRSERPPPDRDVFRDRIRLRLS